MVTNTPPPEMQQTSQELNVPIPDPSNLTTIQILREVNHLRQLLTQRLEEMNQRYEQRFDEQTTAVRAALAAADKAIAQVDASIQRRVDALDSLTDSKFVTFRTLIDSQADKVALALAAADKAVSKAEAANEKRFDQVTENTKSQAERMATFMPRAETETRLASLSEKVDDLKDVATLRTGKGEGLNASWVYLLGGLGAVGTLISIVVVFLAR